MDAGVNNKKRAGGLVNGQNVPHICEFSGHLIIFIALRRRE